jgi:hypothetical protein
LAGVWQDRHKLAFDFRILSYHHQFFVRTDAVLCPPV